MLSAADACGVRRLLALTILCPLVLATPAGASTLRLNGQSGKADFDAAPGETNRVVITDEATSILVTDDAPLAAGTGCDQVGAASVRCPAGRVKVTLGDGDDSFSASGATPVDLDPGAGADTVTGGGGDDAIAARDGVRDVIVCGGGADKGEADLEDEVAADCEAVVRALAPATIGETPAPAGPPAPVPGKAFAGALKSGKVDVVVAGRRVPLDPAVPIPAGAVIDASAGTLALTTASDLNGGTQTANFTGASFSVVQKPGPIMVTELRMAAGDFSVCGRTASRTTARAASKRKIRRLWGSGKGRFRTRGKHSAATVRGTVWSVTDRCDGTLTRVEKGVVVVDDFKRKRSKVLRKGQSYLAKR